MNPFAPIGWLFTAIYTTLATPIEWALTHLTKSFENVGMISKIGSFGLAIIVVTLVIRALLFPLFTWQLKTQRRVQAEQRLLAPQMKELRRKYKGDGQKLQAEMMKLYKEHNISPLAQFAGCLPLLVQLPILGGLYNGIRQATRDVPHAGFLWIGDLSQSAKDVAGGQLGAVLGHPDALVIPVLAAAATFVQSKIMMQPPREDMSDQERQAYQVGKNMMFFAPVMVLMMGLFFPQGIGIYWLTQSLVMVVQEWIIMGWGGLNVPHWFPGHGRVTSLSFSQSPATALSAVGSRAAAAPPVSRPAKVKGGRGQVAAPARATKGGTPPDGARGQGTQGRRPPGRVTPQPAGGGRRKRGR